MKNALLIALVSMFVVTEAIGQDTIFSRRSTVLSKIGIIGGMYFDLSSPKQELCYSICVRGAAVIDHKWIIGGFAQANIADRFAYQYIGLPARIYLGQGGLWAGRFIFPEKKLNLALSTSISGGGFGSELKVSGEEEDVQTIDAYSTEFFQCSPQADVFVKLFPKINLSASIGYRLTLGMKYNPIINNQQMNSLFAQVGFIIGSF